eukprot:6178163-Pleurochrysis_carterae.AAC.4
MALEEIPAKESSQGQRCKKRNIVCLIPPPLSRSLCVRVGGLRLPLSDSGCVSVAVSIAVWSASACLSLFLPRASCRALGRQRFKK